MNGETLVTTESGAVCTEVPERFDLICPTGLRRIAARYGIGMKYGEFNWCKAGNDPEFQRKRLNHVLAHLNLYLAEGNVNNDHLAAAAWGCIALMHYEEGCECHKAPIPGSMEEGKKCRYCEGITKIQAQANNWPLSCLVCGKVYDE